MPRFALLEHDHPFLHWDFMLEAGAALWTWRLAAPPRLGVSVEATRLEDHRLLYLNYQGPVSGNRGQVVQWDSGTFAWRVQEEGHVVIRLEGQRLRGVMHLERETAQTWTGRFVAAEEE
jgi:hypothetical protein